MNIEYYLKLYDNRHNIKNELYLFSNLSYTKTLNGVDSMSFNIPIGYLKDNEITIELCDHIELYRIENNSEDLIWFGVVVNPTNSSINEMSIVCEGYFCLLFNTIFSTLYNDAMMQNNLSLLEKTYYDKTYSDLILQLVKDYSDKTKVIAGDNFDNVKLTTTRIIKWDDLLDEKITEFLENSGLYFTIDKDRKFNIYSKIGEDKSEYYIIHDGNLINCSQAVIDYSAIKNRIYVFNQYTEEDSEGNSIDKYITYVAEDKDSIASFGVKDCVLSVNDLRNIETAEKYANKELLKLSQPNINITIKVVINDELDIFDIEVGDYIYIESDLLNINQKIRVLEYTANIKENTVDIVLGNTIYRDNTVINYKY